MPFDKENPARKKQIEDDFAELERHAKADMGRFWDILDELEPNRKPASPVFPYDERKPRPYGRGLLGRWKLLPPSKTKKTMLDRL